MSIVKIENVTKDYPLGNLIVPALKGVSLVIQKGEFSVIAGPSGSGKTTLLNLIGCVDIPTSGTVSIDGQITQSLSDKKLTSLRLHKIGFIFQSFNLIQVLTAFQNVEFPLLLKGGMSNDERKKKVESVFEQVGLSTYMKHRPNELSGGQRQRVAIARALVSEPSIILADEPTANLDSATGISIIELMKDMNKKIHTTFIFSTHDTKVIDRANRIISIEDGIIIKDELKDKNQSSLAA